MRHLNIRTRLSTQLRSTIADQSALPITLHDYQKEDLELFVVWLENHTARQRCYFPEATGLGKTVEFCTIIAAATELKILVIESSKQLVIQTARDIAEFIDGPIAHGSSVKNIITRDGDEIAHWRDSKSHDVLVVTDEALKLSAEKIRAEFNPDIIIWDESHWGYTKLAQEALKKFPEALIVAFTATPDYLGTVCKPDFIPVTLDNGLTLYADPNRMARTHFGDLIKERTVRWGIENRRLAPLAWGRIDFGFSLKDVPVVDGPAGFDYLESDLHKVLSQNWDLVIWTVVKLYLSNQYGLKGLLVKAMCPSIDAAETLTTALQGIGIKAACITKRTKDDDRARILAEAEAGTLQFLASVFALREGVNIKRAAVAMMLRPTRSRVLYIQFMGRVLRLFGDKVALILDPFYTDTKFAPLSAPVLFGRPGQVVEDGDILIGPPRRRKSKDLSPYRALIAKAQPKIVVERLEIEYWAGEDGFFEADGERWALLNPLAKLLGVSTNIIKPCLERCKTRTGRTANGVLQVFYSLSEAFKLCKEVAQIKDLPQATEDGFFEADGEKWGTMAGIADELSIPDGVIRAKIKSFRSREGRTVQGNCRTFYAFSDVQKTCKDPRKGLLQAGKDGVVELEGEIWGTTGSLAKKLGLKLGSLSNYITEQIPSKEGISSTGNVRPFYPLSVVREACAPLLRKLPLEDEKGFIQTSDGERWARNAALYEELGVGEGWVLKQAQACRKIEGRTRGGIVASFYSLIDMRKAVGSGKLQDLPQVGEDGFFEEDGERWGIITAIAKFLRVSNNAIKPHLSKVRSRKGRNRRQRLDLYSLSDIRQLRPHLAGYLPQVESNGLCELEGEWWGTIKGLQVALGVSRQSIYRRLSGCRSRQGKSEDNRPAVLYPLKELEKACGKLAEKLPIANDEGFFEAEGEKWGLQMALTRRFGIPKSTLRFKMKTASPPWRSKEGKAGDGSHYQFFALSDAEQSCADLIKKYQKKKRSSSAAHPAE